MLSFPVLYSIFIMLNGFHLASVPGAVGFHFLSVVLELGTFPFSTHSAVHTG